MNRMIVVDDTSPLIQYEGSSWFMDRTGSQDNRGNFGPTYNKTLHGTITSASFSFAYNGSGINVVGTNNLRNDSGVLDPQWNCYVDGVQLRSLPNSSFQNNWSLCNVAKTPNVTINDGPHILTVNITVQRGQTFWLDRINYRPSADVPLDDKVIRVENNDADIQYDSHWVNFNGDSNVTSQTGSKVTFHYYGVSLSWFGYIPFDRPRGATSGTYSIDDRTPHSFAIEPLPNAASPTLFNREFFKTPNLSPGPHKLEVVFLGNNNTTPLVLDYLMIRNRTAGVDQTNPSPDDSSGTSNASSHLGAIVGGVLGGLAAILVFLIFLLIYRRRKQRRKDEASRPQNISVIDTTGIKSAHTSPLPNPDFPLSTASQFLPSSKLARYQDQARYNALTPPGFSLGPQSTTASSSGLQSTQHTHSPSEGDLQSDIIIHEDSGMRNVSPPQRPKIEVPPSYTPI